MPPVHIKIGAKHFITVHIGQMQTQSDIKVKYNCQFFKESFMAQKLFHDLILDRRNIYNIYMKIFSVMVTM
jgi:hypothetical protein